MTFNPFTACSREERETLASDECVYICALGWRMLRHLFNVCKLTEVCGKPMALNDKVSAHIGPIIKRSMIAVTRSPKVREGLL